MHAACILAFQQLVDWLYHAIWQALSELLNRCCVPLGNISIVEHVSRTLPCMSCVFGLLLLTIFGACGITDGRAEGDKCVELNYAEVQSTAP